MKYRRKIPKTVYLVQNTVYLSLAKLTLPSLEEFTFLRRNSTQKVEFSIFFLRFENSTRLSRIST
jgi:hypothetical protein